MKKIIATPRRYIQGSGILSDLGETVKPLGNKALILWDAFVKGVVRYPNTTLS